MRGCAVNLSKVVNDFNSAKFAPNGDVADNYTASPRLPPRDLRNPQRTASVSERIAARFKELQIKAKSLKPTVEEPASVVFDEKALPEHPDGKIEGEGAGEDGEEKPAPKVDKGKGRADPPVPASPQVMASPPPLSPPLPSGKTTLGLPRSASPVPPPPAPILLAGLALPPSAVSNLLRRAAAELPLRPVKFPIIGEYKDCFTGEEFVVWLVDNVQGLGNSLDRAEDAARDLVERDGVLRRVGEFGNAFENNEEAFYQFRPKVSIDHHQVTPF